MAETTIDLSIEDVTLTFSDATTPTALTYVTKLTEGTLTIYQGDYNTFMSTEPDGSPVSGGAPRKAGVRQMCGFTVDCSLFDVGINASDETYIDVRENTGDVGTNWTSTTSSPDSEIVTWNATIAVADRGAVTGASYAFSDVRLESGPDITITRDGGWKASDTWRSLTTVKYTKTRNS